MDIFNILSQNTTINLLLFVKFDYMRTFFQNSLFVWKNMLTFAPE